MHPLASGASVHPARSYDRARSANTLSPYSSRTSTGLPPRNNMSPGDFHTLRVYFLYQANQLRAGVS
jgi:hypothetical protein